MLEQRRTQRLCIKSGMVVAFSSAGDRLFANVMDISSTGVFINTDTLLPVDTQLALRLRLPEDLETMDITGRVVWAKEATVAYPAGMGIEFVSISWENKRKIGWFVDMHHYELQATEQRNDFAAAV